MCLLAVCPPGTCMTDDQIEDAWFANSDGGGFAHFTKNGRIRPFRTMKLKAFKHAYHQAVKRHPNSPFLVHFRWATHGAKNVQNVHPFWVTESTIMAHNGVLHVKTDGKRSDTRTFAEDWLTALPNNWLDNPVMVTLVEDFARGSKLAFLTTDDSLEDDWYILNEDDGHWKDGVWFSNNSYRYIPPAKVSYGSWSKSPSGSWNKTPALPAPSTARQSASAFLQALDDGASLSEAAEVQDSMAAISANIEEQDIECPFCTETVGEDMQCYTCKICLDCGDFWEECYCGIGASRLEVATRESEDA